MDEIIKKREELINFFKNEDKKYTKFDILNKEFCVLSFSPNEDLLSNASTPYDNHIENLYDILEQDTIDEIYLKGLVTDVDNKKDYAIIHLFTPENENISISFDKLIFEDYIDYLDVGELIIIKCHMYSKKFYAHFIINLNHEDDFIKEIDYITGESESKLPGFQDSYTNVALVKQAKYFTSKRGNKCLRMEVIDKFNEDKTYISCANYNNILPKKIQAGDFIIYQLSNNESFINNVQKFEV